MRRFLMLFMCAALLSGCERISNIGKIWDYRPFDPAFVILNDRWENAYELDNDWLEDLEVEYEGEIYRAYDDVESGDISTLDYMLSGPAKLRVDRFNPTYFIFGEFNMGDDGEFIIRYKDNEWHVRFDTNILKPGETETKVYVNDELTALENGVWGEHYTIQCYKLFMPSVAEE